MPNYNIISSNRFRDITQTKERGVVESNIMAYVKGMKYGAWVDADARNNGYNSGDLMEQPTYIIESIIRDWILRENDLVVSGYLVVANWISFNGSTGALINTVNDYYNDAYLHHTSKDWVKEVTDYVGASKLCTVSLGAGEMEAAAADNKLYMTNIQGKNKIDTVSIDIVGNATDGTRDGWLFASSINNKTSSTALLSQLCYESWCVLFKSHDKYYLKTLDEAGSENGTWTNPLKDNKSIPKIFYYQTPFENIFTDYILNYAYDYGLGDYRKSHFCNKNSSSDAGNLGAAYKTKCKDAETNYRVTRKFEYSADWIHDDDTAAFLLQKIINWHTIMRSKVTYSGDVKDHLEYEVGDQVKINYSNFMPTGVTNSTKFFITGKRIKVIKGNPEIIFNCVEIA